MPQLDLFRHSSKEDIYMVELILSSVSWQPVNSLALRHIFIKRIRILFVGVPGLPQQIYPRSQRSAQECLSGSTGKPRVQFLLSISYTTH